MRIGTWTVEYAAGADKNERRRSVLQQHDCDLWVLTETHDELAPSAAYEPIHSAQRPTGRLGGRWASIWTRYPVLQRLDVVDPRRTVAALVQAPTGPLIVFGTVMP